ncbi:hypothetical protein SKAU_G00165690 [Synaphobranchus kaupii]|uniref:Uncharacterized protein n=1 Tax=Synaphobranchus kaupii TaxID=118154 RepID=A0A9Q1IY34_SYNKA|nr:hypothetical protein SKAU_G00165690 [Synaphobranchus kaupii]
MFILKAVRRDADEGQCKQRNQAEPGSARACYSACPLFLVPAISTADLSCRFSAVRTKLCQQERATRRRLSAVIDGDICVPWPQLHARLKTQPPGCTQGSTVRDKEGKLERPSPWNGTAEILV